MSYQSMDCLQCVRKHLANAISYAKEVLAGHGEGGDPDHRPDLLGELGNAEHHLSSNEQYIDIYTQILETRRRLEASGYFPYPGFETEIRRIWIALDASDNATNSRKNVRPTRVSTRAKDIPLPEFVSLPEANDKGLLPTGLQSYPLVDVLILPGNSKEELDYIHHMIHQLKGVNKIFKDTIPEDTTDYILVWPPKTGIIRPIDAGVDMPIYSDTGKGNIEWRIKPQIISADIWRDNEDINLSMEGSVLQWDNKTDCYLDLTKPLNSVCCGNKSRLLEKAVFVKWSDRSWKALKAFFDRYNFFSIDENKLT